MNFKKNYRKPNLKRIPLKELIYMLQQNKKGIQQVMESLMDSNNIVNANKKLEVHHFITSDIQEEIRRFKGVSINLNLSNKKKNKLNSFLVDLFNYYTTMFYSTKEIEETNGISIKEIDSLMKCTKQNTLQEKIKDYSKENLLKLKRVAQELLTERMKEQINNLDQQDIIMDDFNAWAQAINNQLKNLSESISSIEIENTDMSKTLSLFCKYKPQELCLVAESMNLEDDSIFPNENLPF
jgi:hypothetical protein